jgi:hypothetical protein
MHRGPRYSDVEAQKAVAVSHSYAEALRKLGMCQTGGNAGTLRKYAELWGISTAHFDSNVGRTHRVHGRITPLGEILVENSTYSRGHLKRRLYEAGLKARRCEVCGQGELWRGNTMSLILDHINGVATDHRLENLRILCPNCAATLETHCGRNVPRTRRCKRCSTRFHPRYGRQHYCSKYCGSRWDRRGIPRPGSRKVERPPYERLLADVQALGYCAVGRRYGVSDNAIRKWIRCYERESATVRPLTEPG